MAKKEGGDSDHLRFLNDGLLDGQGLRWDRIHIAESQGFYLSVEDAAPYVESASKFTKADGLGSRARIIERDEFSRLAYESDDHPVLAYRASDGSGRTVVLFDISDC